MKIFVQPPLPNNSRFARLAFLSCFALLNTNSCDSKPSNEDEGAEDHGDHDDGMIWSCEEDPRYVPFAIGMAASGSTMTATFLSANPPEPEIGKNHWKVRLTDLQGAPLAGLNIKVSTWMPDHNHASPSDGAIVVTEDPLNIGEYSIDKVDMHMAGFWEIRIAITNPDQSMDTILFTMCHNP